jgi:hypothetical protein
MPRIKTWTPFPSRDEAPNCVFIHRSTHWYLRFDVYHRKGRFKGAVLLASVRYARLAQHAAELFAGILGCEVSREEKKLPKFNVEVSALADISPSCDRQPELELEGYGYGV